MKRHNKNVTVLLVGKLDAKGKTLRVWCPFCKRHHAHGWPEGRASNDVEHRVPHCMSKHLHDTAGAYYIGIEPDPDAR